MLKNAFLTLLAVAIAVGLGGGSVWYALQAQKGLGAINIGPWVAFPDIGTADADPYLQARVARNGVLALGRAEGLSFVAEHDSEGRPLRRNCAYAIEGSFPTARFWTLYAADQSLALIDTGRLRRAALHSFAILRKADNSALITVSGRPTPGNWLPVAGTGSFNLVLTFYDTPIANSTGLSDVSLPRIERGPCDA
jgi:hypothetical protein